MRKKFERIAIVARPEQEEMEITLRNLYEFLQTRHIKMTAEEMTAELIPNFKGQVSSFQTLPQDQDLVIVVGGDGSMLRAAKSLVGYNTPVIGINKGRLGFLTDIRPNEIETRLATVLDGDYSEEDRFLLEVVLDGKPSGIALNDVVLSTAKMPHMLEFEIYLDNEFVCSHHADGLITATPTGSTAYALSGGGSIIQTKVDALVLLPMFPHTLSARPIVVPGNSEIRIELSGNNPRGAQLSYDGAEGIKVTDNTKILIRKYAKTLKLIHPLDYNYYETLRGKLHWGKRL